ncbi:proline racemase family protein [Natranaerobius trueperi]|uniref:Proline racemase n=1 Tax=Natranaerobius trueperi TaxID=759412 RepID=A0A226BZJ7_9FIRM|nr:proline racemase family protein [Natranaerobius trueperi]OWZ84365.1 proline racemase [Natranaerobius trueperi]
MKFDQMITAVDSHTMGEPTRVVTGGLPSIKGNSMVEKRDYLEKNYDNIRTALMYEPRGHRDMFGSILLEPTNSKADIGIIFMDGGGYLNMCGHGSIGASKVIVETGMVPVTEPYTKVTLESPAGLINAFVKVENGYVGEVTIENVPSFLYKENVSVDVKGIGTINLDISFGGSYFALVDKNELGVEIDVDQSLQILETGLEIRKAVNEQVEIKHPELSNIKTVDLVEIYDKKPNTDADVKNVVVFGQGQIDRSPCGTGLSAKMASLFGKGQLDIGKKYVSESITGTRFIGELIKGVTVGDYNAVIPKVTGNAFITGLQKFVIQKEDPLAYGFEI